jgi:hypothetical protein
MAKWKYKTKLGKGKNKARIDVDVNAVINIKPETSAPVTHASLWQLDRVFVKLYSVINKNIFLFRTTFFYPVKLCGSR